MDKEIIEGNRLIAEFAGTSIEVSGWHNAAYKYAKDWRNEDRLFHSSWDWQIPVWGKVALAVKTLIPKLPNPEFNAKWYFRNVSEYEKSVFNNKPEDGQKIIVELITWLNQNNQ